MRVKTENNNLVRDVESMALLNVDASIISKDAQYKLRLKKEKETEQQINSIQGEVKEIKEQITKILEILSRGH